MTPQGPMGFEDVCISGKNVLKCVSEDSGDWSLRRAKEEGGPTEAGLGRGWGGRQCSPYLMEERVGQDHQMLGLLGQGEGEGRAAWPGLARVSQSQPGSGSRSGGKIAAGRPVGGWEGGLRGLSARRPVLMGWGGALGRLGAGGAQRVGVGGDGG